MLLNVLRMTSYKSISWGIVGGTYIRKVLNAVRERERERERGAMINVIETEKERL